MNPTMNAIDIAVSDLDAAIAFARLVGLDFRVDVVMPEHAACDLPGGAPNARYEKLAGTTRPGWTRAAGSPGLRSPPVGGAVAVVSYRRSSALTWSMSGRTLSDSFQLLPEVSTA